MFSRNLQESSGLVVVVDVYPAQQYSASAHSWPRMGTQSPKIGVRRKRLWCFESISIHSTNKQDKIFKLHRYDKDKRQLENLVKNTVCSWTDRVTSWASVGAKHLPWGGVLLNSSTDQFHHRTVHQAGTPGADQSHSHSHSNHDLSSQIKQW